MRSALERLHLTRSALERQQFVVAYVVNGSQVKWLTWDKRKVWRWGKSKRLAARFPTESQAVSAAESTSMVWQYNYQVHRY
jgi:hypothetical protein